MSRVLDQALKSNNNISVRALARSAGLGAAYVSELLNAKSGSPSLAACQKLDRALGTHLDTLVGGIRRHAAHLKKTAYERRHRRRPHRTQLAASGSRQESRVQVIATVLTGDEELLRVTEDISQLPDAIRRILGRLISDLADALPAS